MQPAPGLAVVGPCIVAAMVGGANLAQEHNGLEASTAHADYAIEEDADGVRILRVNGQNASREDGTGIGHPYIESIEDLVYAMAALEGRTVRVLVIGAGSFTCWRGRPDGIAVVVYVDVDDRLGEVADTFLAPLLREDEVYDVIVLDAFVDRTTMPAHLHTREFFGLVRSHVAEDGGTV